MGKTNDPQICIIEKLFLKSISLYTVSKKVLLSDEATFLVIGVIIQSTSHVPWNHTFLQKCLPHSWPSETTDFFLTMIYICSETHTTAKKGMMPLHQLEINSTLHKKLILSVTGLVKKEHNT